MRKTTIFQFTPTAPFGPRVTLANVMTRRFLMAVTLPALLLAKNPAIDKAAKLSKEGKHDEAIAALEAELKKTPKDPELKTALGQAYTASGEATMFNEALPPFRKYPTALRLFRKAVENDPNAKKAKEHIATIEGIYKSMGRPVPQ
jgi:tetratricopeptide (TPR) repeat protein